MDIIEDGLKILEQLGLSYDWRDQTHDLLDITDPATGEQTCREPYGAACLLGFLMRAGKLKIHDGDKDTFLAQVEELNRLAETFGNSVDVSPNKRLHYWRHQHPTDPKDKTSPRIFTVKDALDPKRRHCKNWWYFDRDEIAELRKTILHDRAIYAQYFTIED